jgi:hypothetical protein
VPARESDRFMNCVEFLHCSGDTARSCVESRATQYADQRGEHERQRWLDNHGCPRDRSGFTESDEDIAAARLERIGYVQTDYDEFTRSREVTYRGRTMGGARFVFHSSVHGNVAASFFGVVSSGAGWAYLDCHSLNMLADDVPVALPRAAHRGDVRTAGPGGVTEMVSVELPGEALEQLRAARTVRFRICRDVFSFELQHVGRIHEFVDAIRNAGSDAPAP